jgi:hypothetical protein
MADKAHLSALRVRLSHEHDYLARAKSQKEIAIRTVWIAQIEKEIAAEIKFLGTSDDPIDSMSDDDLLRELGA